MIHEALLVAVHEQALVVDTLTIRVPARSSTFWSSGEIEDSQEVAAEVLASEARASEVPVPVLAAVVLAQVPVPVLVLAAVVLAQVPVPVPVLAAVVFGAGRAVCSGRQGVGAGAGAAAVVLGRCRPVGPGPVPGGSGVGAGAGAGTGGAGVGGEGRGAGGGSGSGLGGGGGGGGGAAAWITCIRTPLKSISPVRLFAIWFCRPGPSVSVRLARWKAQRVARTHWQSPTTNSPPS